MTYTTHKVRARIPGAARNHAEETVDLISALDCSIEEGMIAGHLQNLRVLATTYDQGQIHRFGFKETNFNSYHT
jgi:hypothetical protein